MHHTAELARRSASITHAHDDGQHGAALQAAAAFLALDSAPAVELDADRFLRDVARVVPSPAWHEKLERIPELLRVAATPGHAARALGHDITALGSVPLALLAFLIRDDPTETIRYAIRAGGDTDTIAAMAGALAGARYGAAALPRAWVDRLEITGRIRAVGERFAWTARGGDAGEESDC